MNVGDVVGNYRITEVLGEGGMGVVYLGSHKLIGREAAIKVLLPSLSNKQDVVQRFFNEAKTTTSIKHPGIVEVFDFGYSDQGHAYIVMERLEGETLEHRIKRLGRMPAEKAMGLFGQITRALGAAHGLSVVHRDLKPANIYIVSDPDVSGGERAKILDFGIAKLRNAGNVGVRTQSGQLMGAPDYMAPEQCLGASEVDQRADLYALGCMLFHAVTGKPPFVGANFSEVLAAHVSAEPPRAKTMAPVPSALDSLIHRLMQKAPEERPQTTDEVLQLLKAAISAKTSAGLAPPQPARSKPKPPTAPPPVPPSSRRTVLAPSQPPPVPIGNDVPSGVVDSSAPLPPLPRPKAGLPPPVPKAAAHARTLYTDPKAAEQPARPPGPLHDPRLAKTMVPGPMAGNPVLSVPGPMGPAGEPAAPAMPPQMPPQQPPPRPAPTAPVGAAPPQAAGPRGTMAMPPSQAAPAMYPRRQPEPSRPMRPQQAVDIGPRRGNPVRPTEPGRSGGGSSPWKVIAGIILIVGASAGGFFVYKSATKKKAADSVATVAAIDAGTTTAVAAIDAQAKAPPIDARAAVAAAADAGATPVADAAVIAAAPIDAAAVAVVAPPIDAALKPIASAPDASAPVTNGTARSGRVIDPELKSATGGDDGIETVTLKIETVPPGATVMRIHDKLVLGKTPIEFVTRKFNANEKFELKLPGFFPVTEKMSTFRDSKRLVHLLKKPN